MIIGKVGKYIQTEILRSDHAAREEETELYKRIAQETIDSTYVEEDPSVSEWFRDLVPTAAGTLEYFQNLFPSASWVRRYNLHWLLGDAIAGKCRCNYDIAIADCYMFRRHGWPGGRPTGHGLCVPCTVEPCLWLVHYFHGRLLVLDFRDLQGHSHRCRFPGQFNGIQY